MKTTTSSVQAEAEKRAALARLVRSTSEMVRNAFAPGGCVRTRFMAEIDALPDTEVAIRAYAVTLGPRISDAIHGEIRETLARARNAAMALNAKTRRVSQSVTPAVVRFTTGSATVLLGDESWFSRARNVFFGGMFGCSVGHIIGMALCFCGWRTAPFFLSCACMVLGLVCGYLDVRRRSCRGHKAKLVAHVNAVLTELQAKYFTPQRVGEVSEIDRCMAVLCGTAPDRLPQEHSNREKPDDRHETTAQGNAKLNPKTEESLCLGVRILRQRAASLIDWVKGKLQNCYELANERFGQSSFAKKSRQIAAIIRS